MAQFARTWRPKQFEDVVGQELVISLLRNTLYRDSLFPVYLFAGQRGCGKTTLARIFATAINCEQRAEFSQKPLDIQIPCRTCHSCLAMQDGSHTDFHEIDAASHTGVDHVRTLLEATVLVPQMGNKKIYLIDEVHMLSRAACNALLKTLEEPLDSVIFLMATTDPHKIIDTVRSRCFQLFLKPFSREQIIKRLVHICDNENIAYDQEGLLLLTHSAEGSLRDAINTLERAVMAYGRVFQAEVSSLVGMVAITDILDLLEAIASADVALTLKVAQSAPLLLAGVPQACRMLSEVLRALVWLHHGITVPDMAIYELRLQALLARYPLARIIAAWDVVYVMEQRMLKSAHPQAAWELTLVKLCQPLVSAPHINNDKNNDKREALPLPKMVMPLPVRPASQQVAQEHSKPTAAAKNFVVQQPQEREKVSPVEPTVVSATAHKPMPSGEALWEQVLAHMQNPAEQGGVTALAKNSMSGPRVVHKTQRVPLAQAAPIVHDEITKKMLTLFPGTLTQELEGEKI